MSASPIRLVCFDMDKTLLNGHMDGGQIKAELYLRDKDQLPSIVEEHLKNTGGIRNPATLLATMRLLLQNGVNIAITSYTAVPEVIPHLLRIIGLKPDEIDRIKIFSGIPEVDDVSILGKNLHIMSAMGSFGITDPGAVVLVDDNLINVSAARSMGCRAIPVRPEAGVEYLDDLRLIAGLPRLAPAAMAARGQS